MSALDKNKIFFGMVKYILSEQKNVDWVFKTSIMSYNGAKQTLSDTSSNEVMNNLIDFIYEMKPYHVQFSEFQSGYEPDMELCNVSCVEKLCFTTKSDLIMLTQFLHLIFRKHIKISGRPCSIPIIKRLVDNILGESNCIYEGSL